MPTMAIPGVEILAVLLFTDGINIYGSRGGSYRKTSNRSRVSNSSRVSNTSRGSKSNVLIEAGGFY